MNLGQLKEIGGFIQSEPVKVPVEWKGHTFDVFIKKLAFGDVEALLANEDDRSRSAKMIAASVLLGDDQEAISYEDAYRLDVSLATKLIQAINQANGQPDGVTLPN